MCRDVYQVELVSRADRWQNIKYVVGKWFVVNMRLNWLVELNGELLVFVSEQGLIGLCNCVRCVWGIGGPVGLLGAPVVTRASFADWRTEVTGWKGAVSCSLFDTWWGAFQVTKTQSGGGGTDVFYPLISIWMSSSDWAGRGVLPLTWIVLLWSLYHLRTSAPPFPLSVWPPAGRWQSFMTVIDLSTDAFPKTCPRTDFTLSLCPERIRKIRPHNECDPPVTPSQRPGRRPRGCFHPPPAHYIILLIFHSYGQKGLRILQHQVDKWRFLFFTSDRPRENKKSLRLLSLWYVSHFFSSRNKNRLKWMRIAALIIWS